VSVSDVIRFLGKEEVSGSDKVFALLRTPFLNVAELTLVIMFVLKKLRDQVDSDMMKLCDLSLDLLKEFPEFSEEESMRLKELRVQAYERLVGYGEEVSARIVYEALTPLCEGKVSEEVEKVWRWSAICSVFTLARSGIDEFWGDEYWLPFVEKISDEFEVKLGKFLDELIEEIVGPVFDSSVMDLF
jgi:hypothetical protein